MDSTEIGLMNKKINKIGIGEKMNNKFDFSAALALLKSGKKLTRIAYGKDIFIKMQHPDDQSKMTESYLYMSKKIDGNIKLFPMVPSIESILADDWYIVN